MKAIILNSGVGSRLKDLTSNNPKTMVKLNDKDSIFSKAMNILVDFDIDEFIITTGYLDNVLKDYILSTFGDLNFRFVHNPVYDTTNYIKSLDYIKDDFDDDILLLHGDLVFDKEVVEKLVSATDSSIVIDSKLAIPEKDFKAEVIDNKVNQISVKYFGDNAVSCQPFYKLTNHDWLLWKKRIHEFCQNDNTDVYAEEALNELLNKEIYLNAIDINGYYCSEIDTKEDLEKYKQIGDNNE